VDADREQQWCDHQRAEEVAYPPALDAEPERAIGGDRAIADTDGDHGAGESRQRDHRGETQHVMQTGEGNRSADDDVHHPHPRQACAEFHEEQDRRRERRHLWPEHCVCGHLGDEAEAEQRGPVARRVQQQEREQGASGRPEHAHPARGDQQGEAHSDSQEVQREINNPRLEGT